MRSLSELVQIVLTDLESGKPFGNVDNLIKTLHKNGRINRAEMEFLRGKITLSNHAKFILYEDVMMTYKRDLVTKSLHSLLSQNS